ncbi:enterochelin esterase [Bailinhaonella thermotolerans]|uniref:enterochelin esterase n=1 Tax=Bailinhaonella thermotolerans TaxID=1070861 RepID=UPI00192A5B05|nr:enterochelin esterase [Bailinhaonella thermotolerans]
MIPAPHPEPGPALAAPDSGVRPGPVRESGAAAAARAVRLTPPRPGPRGSIPPQVERPAPPEVAVSPRIAALGSPAELWREAAGAGTPLIEEIPGDPAHRIVTFLWRDPDPAADVVLVVNKITDAGALDAARMEHVPGTDVWHRSYRLRADWHGTYRIAPRSPGGMGPAAERMLARMTAAGSRVPRADLERWCEAVERAAPDPLNRRPWPGAGSVAALPDAPARDWHGNRGTGRGRVTERRVWSARLGNERPVWTYEPEEEPAGVVLLFDGEAYAPLLRPALDDLIADGALPPLRFVMPSAVDLPTRVRELACDPGFADFAADLLPEGFPPGRVVVAGSSLGGLTAAYCALRDPARFGNAISLSGSFWWPNGPEPEWLTGAVSALPPVPARFRLGLGAQEWALRDATFRMRDALAASGHDVALREYNGGHDYYCWRACLVALLGDLTASW